MLNTLYKALEKPGIYDAMMKLLGGDRVIRKLKQEIRCALDKMNYDNVLDVGCGTGLFSDCFDKSYIGIDINPHYIQKGKAEGRRDFFVADARDLPFLPETFGLVFTLGVLHHLDAGDREKMLAEMLRVCAPGGHMLIVDGLVPSDRFNVVGYVLAKLDRGRFKMKLRPFKKMIECAFPDISPVYEIITVGPYVFVLAVLRKGSEKGHGVDISAGTGDMCR